MGFYLFLSVINICFNLCNLDVLVDEVLYSSLFPRESIGDYLFCFIFNEKNMGRV